MAEDEIIKLFDEEKQDKLNIKIKNDGKRWKEKNNCLLLRVAKQFIYNAKDKSKERLEKLVDEFLFDCREKLSDEQAECLVHMLQLALKERYFNVVEKLVNSYTNEGNWKNALKNNNFHLLRECITSSKKDTEQKKEDDAITCLELLYKLEIITDVNQEKKLSNENFVLCALNSAANHNYQRVMAFLIKKGACMNNENRKWIRERLTAETLTDIMDHFIKLKGNSEKSDEGVVEIDYKFLVKPFKDEVDQNETETLMDICHSRTHRAAINHPLVKTFVHAKWSKIWKFFYILLTVVTLCSFVLACLITWLTWPMPADQRNSTNNAQTHVAGLKISILVFCVIELFMDVIWWIFLIKFQWPLRSKIYRIVEMIFHPLLMFLIVIFTLVPLGDNIGRHFAAWIVPITWLAWMVHLGQNVPSFKIFITMLRKISWHVLKLTIIIAVLVLAFSLSLSNLISANKASDSCPSLVDFNSPWYAFPRVFAMATGEFGYDCLRNGLLVEEHPAASVSAVLLFLLFVFLVFLVIMNVMTGIAIVEAQNITDTDYRDTLHHQLGVAYLLEQIVLDKSCGKMLQNWLPSFVTHQIPQYQLFPNQQRTLEVHLNHKPGVIIKHFRTKTTKAPSAAGSSKVSYTPVGGCCVTVPPGGLVAGGSNSSLESGDGNDKLDCGLHRKEGKELRRELMRLLDNKYNKEQEEKWRQNLAERLTQIEKKMSVI